MLSPTHLDPIETQDTVALLETFDVRGAVRPHILDNYLIAVCALQYETDHAMAERYVPESR